MRCCLCVKLQPCEILPGLQEAYYPETDCRAYAEKTCPYYAIEKKTACFTGRSGGVSCMGKGLIPNPAKMGFYCVTYNQNCTYEKTGRGGYLIAAASRLFLSILHSSTKILIIHSVNNTVHTLKQSVDFIFGYWCKMCLIKRIWVYKLCHFTQSLYCSIFG